MKHNTLFRNQSCKWQFILKCRREIKISLNKSFGQQRKHFQNILHESFCWWYLPIHIWVPVLVYIFYRPLNHTFCSFCTSSWVRFYILDDKMFCTFSYIRRSKRIYRADIIKCNCFIYIWPLVNLNHSYSYLIWSGFARCIITWLAILIGIFSFALLWYKNLYDILWRVYIAMNIIHSIPDIKSIYKVCYLNCFTFSDWYILTYFFVDYSTFLLFGTVNDHFLEALHLGNRPTSNGRNN